MIVACEGRHRASGFRAVPDQVEAAVPDDLDAHLVLDNAATHETRLVHDRWPKRPRWHLHFPPTSASWLTWSGSVSRKNRVAIVRSRDEHATSSVYRIERPAAAA